MHDDEFDYDSVLSLKFNCMYICCVLSFFSMRSKFLKVICFCPQHVCGLLLFYMVYMNMFLNTCTRFRTIYILNMIESYIMLKKRMLIYPKLLVKL